ncbi:hypothetical protein [Streptomyces sp. NBC_00455]|uniref:hypothetical protein n=1 Tax=Streptomyces sp. NBC_00455 TaxID=2903654 RepID=UPI002E1F5BCD
MEPDRFPRLLSAVHAVAARESTLLTTRTGHHRGPAGLHPLLHRLGPLLDGRTAESEVLARVPEPQRPVVRGALDHLEGCGALRREATARPEGLCDELLAVADQSGDAPYARCAALLAAEAVVRAPARWLPLLEASLRQLSVRAVRAEPSSGTGVLVRIGETETRPAPDAGWPGERSDGAGRVGDVERSDGAGWLGDVERAVAAAAVAAEAVARFLGRPARPLPGAGALPGLDRRGPRTSPGAPLLDAWPEPEQLRALLLDPASLLPQEEPAYERPAALRPFPGRLPHPGAESCPDSGPGSSPVAAPRDCPDRGPRPPDWLRALLRCVHVPLRWESGDLAHSGGWAHRGLASARGFYPVELYLVTDTGAWYVEPGELRLIPVSRPGAAGLGSRFTLILTVRETKVSHRYDRYATRLCLQEAGLALAALDDAARSVGVTADTVAELGERGRGGLWGGLLDLGPDERPVGRVVLHSPQRSLDQAAFERHLALVRRRRSGHRVFNALGADRTGRLGSLPAGVAAELATCQDDGLRAFLVVHRPCADAAGGRWSPGSYRISGQDSPMPVRTDSERLDRIQCGSEPTDHLQHGSESTDHLQPGFEPTEQLQRGQDAMGWLAPDYLSASATLIVAAPADTATTNLRQLHRTTAAAARIVHRALLGAAAAGAAGRIHNSLRAEVIAAISGEQGLAPLFQLIVGCPGPDGTITVEVAEAASDGAQLTTLTGETVEYRFTEDGPAARRHDDRPVPARTPGQRPM